MLIFTSATVSAQETDFLTTMSTHFSPAENDPDFRIHTDHSNELKTVSSLLFMFYKDFISSQDINSCVFTPSCSVYAIESISKKGLITGLMASFDRITRCSALAYGYYDIDKKTNLNIDPVE